MGRNRIQLHRSILMLMLMMVMSMMLMVMIGCNGSIGNSKEYRTTWNTPIPMVHTETPASTSTPIPLSHDQVQEQVIDVLILFNDISNSFAVFMTTTAIFQNNGMMVPEATASLVIPGLDIYAHALTSWKTTEFEDSTNIGINAKLNHMRESEIEKTALFKTLSQQLQMAYIDDDIDQVKAIAERMYEFGQSDIAKQTVIIQYHILKELSISPDAVNFRYADVVEKELESKKPLAFDKM